MKKFYLLVNLFLTWDIKILNEGLYNRVKAEGSLGLGESYMDGWWDAKRVDELISHLLAAGLLDKVRITPKLDRSFAKSIILNRQTAARAKRNASHQTKRSVII